MRIQHNIPAMNSYRNYTANTKAVSKNLEKLSSGYRINRAGDDAAGLAISEKMRAQVTGLKTAQRNAKDGISLIQTAEGALTEVHSMLNRMVELADQSANGTFDDTTDRANLQKELTQLKSEVDRIADSTNFNGIKLLDGKLSTEKVAGSVIDPNDPNAPKSVLISGDVTRTDALATKSKYLGGAITAASSDEAGTATFTFDYTDKDGSAKKFDLTIAIANADDHADISAKLQAELAKDDTLSKLFTIGDDGSDRLTVESNAKGAGQPLVTGMTMTASTTGGTKTLALGTTGITSTKSADPSTTLTFAGTPDTGDDLAGKTFTIGDKTYEILTDVTKVKEGNIAVQAGTGTTDGSMSLDNLVKALQANGVKSASAVVADDGTAGSATTATGIKIGDLSEISVAQKGLAATSDSLGVSIGNTIDTKGEYQFTAQAAAGTTGNKLTIEYLDESGKKQQRVLDYIGATADAADNATAMAKAIKDDEVLSKLFDVKADGDDISLTAKTAGTGGARLIGAKNDEANQGTNGIDGGIVIAKEATDAGKELSLTNDLKENDTITIDGKTYQFVKDPSKVEKGNIAVTFALASDTAGNIANAKNLANALASNGVDMNFDTASGKISIKDSAASATEEIKGGLTLQIGDTSDSFNRLTVSINDMHAENLGIADIDIGNQDDAAAAVEVIKNAINKVSSTRGDLGAAQNRLDHTINNLSVMTENIQDAEASIRDVDVADEMMSYTKNNILVQSAQAMLAQANQLPQGVLQLLG